MSPSPFAWGVGGGATLKGNIFSLGSNSQILTDTVNTTINVKNKNDRGGGGGGGGGGGSVRGYGKL